MKILLPSQLKQIEIIKSFTPSIKIVGLDISYRSTGVAFATLRGNELSLNCYKTYDNPISGMGFMGMQAAAMDLDETVNEFEEDLESYGCDIIIAELPAYTQSAKAAVLIGACWGAWINTIRGKIIVPPSALKKWSKSKRGDKKLKVRLKVEEETGITVANDNIADAIGLVLLVRDELIKQNDQAD